MPAFICLIEFDGKNEPQSAFLKHVDKSIIEKTLKRIRELDVSGEGNRLNKREISIGFDEGEHLERPFEESLKKEGMTLEEYKKRLSEQILVSQFVSQKIRNKIIVSDEQVKRYMEANKEIGESEAFRLRQIFFKTPKDENEKKPVMEKASLVIQRLKAGEDFSALAKEYSDDPSGKIGGDIGYVKKSYMAAELADMLSKMNTGDFSAPFWTERGLHIIKLDEKVSKQTTDELKASARRQLVEEQFLEKYKSYIKGLREKARIEIRL
jgi:peptidyl-prolyl cis-trans isomerase SurA